MSTNFLREGAVPGALLRARQAFLERAVERLARDPRVLAVLVSGSTGRGQADDWSDLDLVLVSGEDPASLLSGPHEAEEFGDLAIWVDCSWNAPPGGTMAFSRYLAPEGMLLVDWTVWPAWAGRRTTGTELLWSAAGFELESFDGNVAELTLSRERRQPPPHSRQQRAEWELCMCHIAMSRPARQEDAGQICDPIGIAGDLGSTPEDQLEAVARHVAQLEPWITPRAYAATLQRLTAIRSTLALTG